MRSVLVRLLLLSLAQCGSRSGLDGALGLGDATTARLGADGAATLVIPRRCVDDWQTVYQASGSLSGALAISDDELVFGEVELSATAGRGELAAVNVAAGGAGGRRTISSGASFSQLWVEGSHVLFWRDLQLYRVPLAGGPALVEFDARTPGLERREGSLLVQPDTLYWTQLIDDARRAGLWRGQRPNGERERIVWLEVATGDSGLAAGDGRVVLAGSGRDAAVVLDTGTVTVLDSVDDATTFAGIDALGVYYSRTANRSRRGGRALEFEIQRAPADGSESVPLWRGAAGQYLGALWPYDTGWLATGYQYRDDGRQHALVAYIDSAGTAHPLACARDAATQVLGRPMPSDGALYLITRTRDVYAIVAVELAAGDLN